MKDLLHRSLALLLIVAIGLLGIAPEAFHDHQESAGCVSKHELEIVDLCHWNLHHGIKKCEGHTHVTAIELDCAFCDLVCASTWLIDQKPTVELHVSCISGKSSDAVVISTVHNFNYGWTQRGPPLSPVITG